MEGQRKLGELPSNLSLESNVPFGPDWSCSTGWAQRSWPCRVLVVFIDTLIASGL